MGMSPVVKLETLVSAYTGEIKSKVRACMKIENPTDGYERALELLDERYGDEDAFVNQMLHGTLMGPSIRSGDVKGLRKFLDELEECFHNLSVLKQTREIDNRYGLYLLANRLPKEIRDDYIKQRRDYKVTHKERPGIQWLIHFIHKAASDAETINVHNPVTATKDQERDMGVVSLSPDSSQGQQRVRALDTATSPLSQSERGRRCVACHRGSHTLKVCQQFHAMSAERRILLVRGKRLCFSCLSPNHLLQECISAGRCGVDGCRAKHSWLLHPNSSNIGRGQGTRPKVPVGQERILRRREQMSFLSNVNGTSTSDIVKDTYPAPKRQRRDQTLTDMSIVHPTSDHRPEASRAELITNVTREAETRGEFQDTANPYKWVNEERAGRARNNNHVGKEESNYT
ncbi:uncharacterized protein LOC123519047 isoform X1 [Portunus trituberculatus]|uniref:uncharacterized protein LOC123519047 isoform X1 n=1 Tax=Portunus trituberculatus TaxID=210409 RepID=UPI001E1CD3B3|nr:uncharacterized protein LOC123519047 isoform X1 [Portunus trituberculatus]